MRTIRSASTRRSGSGRKTKRTGVLATLVVLAAVSGALNSVQVGGIGDRGETTAEGHRGCGPDEPF